MTEAGEGWKRTGRPRECRSTATWKRSWRKRSLGLMSDVFPHENELRKMRKLRKMGKNRRKDRVDFYWF